MLGAEEDGVPTLKVDTSTCWVVPAILVSAASACQVPTNVTFDGFVAKQDSALLLLTADAKAPEESIWRMWRPGETPVNADILS